jgi:GMP synthase (glutamine-hydrolysing)
MATLIALQHVEREGPGLLTYVAMAQGWSLRVNHLWRGDPLPTLSEAGAGQVLVSLSGPMGLADLGDPRWPWLEVELGICLGAQLLARAGGGGAISLEVGEPPQRLLTNLLAQAVR